MTVIDTDKREKACPECGAARLIFITYAPKLRPEGKSVQYRCRDCAIAEAAGAPDPLVVLQHGERRGLPEAWRNDRCGEQPERLKQALQKRKERFCKPIPRVPAPHDASVAPSEETARRNTASSARRANP